MYSLFQRNESITRNWSKNKQKFHRTLNLRDDRGVLHMKNNIQQTKFVILVATFISIQVVMTLIPFLGFIPLPAVNITTLHIPTILAGILLGVKGGAIVGLSFGVMSVINATIRPTALSFMFSPFAPAPAGFSGNPLSLVVAILPRVVLGVLAALVYQFIRNKGWELTLSKQKGLKLGAATLSAVIATFIHTLMVVSLWIVFFARPLQVARELEGLAGVFAFVGAIITSNALFEAALAGVLMTGFVLALEPIVKNAFR